MRHAARAQVQPQVEQRVLADAHALVKAHVPVKQLPHVQLIPDVVVDAVHMDDLAHDLRGLLHHRLNHNRHAPPQRLVKERVVRRDDLRAGAHRRLIQPGEGVLLQRVVRIDERDVAPLRHGDAPVARGGHAGIERMHNLRARLRFGKRIENRAGRVRGAVVDEDHLDLRRLLRLEALQTNA